MTHRALVVGAGVSGLAAAWALARAGVSVTVLERAGRIGGLVETERAGGVLMEHGADGLLSNKRGGGDVLGALGLAGALTRGGRAPRRALLLRDERLAPMPGGLFAFERRAMFTMLASSILSIRGKARLAAEAFVPTADWADESVAAFFTRRFGAEVALRLSGPMMRGIYGADARELGMHAVLPTLAEYERRYGSVSAALALAPRRARGDGLVSIDGGMSRIARRLVDASGARVVRRSPVVCIEREGPGFEVRLADDRVLHTDAVVVATDASAATSLLMPHSDELGELLGAIDSTSVDVVTLGWSRQDVLHPLDATGFVVGDGVGRTVACTFVSEKWHGRAPEGQAVFRSVLRAKSSASDDEVARAALDEIRTTIRARGEPSLVRVRRRPAALPVYGVGHGPRIARARALTASLGPIAIAGNYLSGVGVPDCIASGLDAGQSVLEKLAARRVSPG